MHGCMDARAKTGGAKTGGARCCMQTFVQQGTCVHPLLERPHASPFKPLLFGVDVSVAETRYPLSVRNSKMLLSLHPCTRCGDLVPPPPVHGSSIRCGD